MATATASEQGLKLIKLEVDHVLRVDAVSVDANGKHVQVNGKNGAGKSSLLNALFGALEGLSAKDFPEPIHRGAKKGTVRLDLGELIVERTWTEKSQRLRVTAKDGSEYTSPQKVLDSLLGRFAMDPSAFMRRRPQDQVDDVLNLAGVAPPVDRVKAIATGLVDDVRKLEPHHAESADAYLMRLSADESGMFYLRRRSAHQNADRALKALEKQRAEVEAAGGAIDAESQPLSASDLIAQVERLNQRADQRRQAERHFEEQQRILNDGHNLLTELIEEKTKAKDEIEELRKKLAEKEKALDVLDGRINIGRSKLEELKGEVATAQAAVAAIEDPRERILTVREQIKTIEATNENLTRRRIATEQMERYSLEVESAQAAHKREEEALEALRYLRKHLLDDIDLGVPGLAIGDGELTLNGISFRQASQAEQIRTACAIAFRQNPKLKLLRLDEAEHLDSESKRIVFEMADRYGWQCIMASVSDSDELVVEIVEREAA